MEMTEEILGNLTCSVATKTEIKVRAAHWILKRAGEADRQ
jgi:hypothetical protein